jgi:glycine amidinotransferase
MRMIARRNEMNISAKRVNSHDEWSPLQEVIVGTARGAVYPAYEPAFAALYAPNSPERRFEGRPYPPEAVSDAERQLDHFADLLERLGITVTRPDPVDHSVGYRTPDWEVPFGRAQACPRDILLVIGDEIIEAPMAQRARFFEYRAYRRLIHSYFRAGARWTTAPKPLMSNNLYRPDYSTVDEPYDFETHANLTEVEPCFDAACFVRFGRDIFWQPDLVINQFGADWLARHLGEDYRIHRVEFDKRTPQHIDTTLVPIRPGIVLINPERPFKKAEEEQLFKTNGWRLIPAPPSVRTGIPAAPDVSNWLSMNVLCLDEKTVIVEAAEDPMAELLKSLGYDIIRCAFDAVFKFGGSFHCCTADVRREGRLRSYFSSLDA